MRQNVASQTIGAQLVSATDGSAVTTGTTTVSVTIDAGTQGAGAGTVVHEGNGYWSYAPTQAETNGAHVAFTFANAAAISVTAQVYTTFPQTGDSFARLGAPAGASVSADIAVIEGQTDDIGVAGAGLTALATQASVNTIDSNVDAILVDTAEIGVAGAGLTALSTQASVNTIDANVDAILVDTAEIGLAGAGLTEAGGTGDHLTAINLPDQTMNITGNITGNLSGSVGSFTGAVGSVTGNVGGNVVGSVASVTGAVGSISGVTFPTNFSDLAITTGQVTVGTNNDKTGYSLAAGSVASTTFAAGAIDAVALSTDAAQEIRDAVLGGTVTELSALPAASPTLNQALALLYMSVRNRRDTTATSDEIHNDAGAVILTASLSDDGTVFSKSEYA